MIGWPVCERASLLVGTFIAGLCGGSPMFGGKGKPMRSCAILVRKAFSSQRHEYSFAERLPFVDFAIFSRYNAISLIFKDILDILKQQFH